MAQTHNELYGARAPQSTPRSWRILIVDDVPTESRICEVALETVRGYETRTEQYPLRAQTVASEWRPDLIILDVSMPKMDGFTLARRLIDDGSAASLMFVTSSAEPYDQVDGLELADEYITKPFDIPILLARVKKVLQRRERSGKGMSDGRPEIDLATRRVRVPGGRSVTLTSTELRLLLALLEGNGAPVANEKLLQSVWQVEQDVDDTDDDSVRKANRQLIQSNISRLRKKLERDSTAPELIESVSRVGYRYVLKRDQG